VVAEDRALDVGSALVYCADTPAGALLCHGVLGLTVFGSALIVSTISSRAN